MSASTAIAIRSATLADLSSLVAIEQQAFDNDRLSRRSLKHWINNDKACLLVAEYQGELVGYGLVWYLKGTRLSRLYSLAVTKSMRGHSIGRLLLEALEGQAADKGRLFMRLEVAKSNVAAIALYQKLGFNIFGEYSDYYEDHTDALRMQKTIAKLPKQKQRNTLWYQQTTEFTCGPAALMMAMATIEPNVEVNQTVELDIWREATTIFMTSGHGGCHPLGLGLAAKKRGFNAEVYINTDAVLFVDGVRTEAKKQILTAVHQQFLEQAQHQQVGIHYLDISATQVKDELAQGNAVLLLISTYRLDRKKAPHWVTVTAMDDHCIYIHDPYPMTDNHLAFDCQYVPIALADFDKMSVFGSNKLRTAVIIKR
ncbi:peptidase C39 family protein [Colwellia sp. MEBiC06753]